LYETRYNFSDGGLVIRILQRLQCAKHPWSGLLKEWSGDGPDAPDQLWKIVESLSAAQSIYGDFAGEGPKSGGFV